MRARHIQQMQCDARPAKSRLRGADTREVRTRIESPKGCRLTNAGPLKNRAVNQDEECGRWSPTALQPWALLGLRRNPPKRVLLRQGFGGHPLRIPPQLYSCGFLRRRVKACWRDRVFVEGILEESATFYKRQYVSVLGSFA